MSELRVAVVTGASGLAGGAIVRRLAREGHRVRVLLRAPDPALATLANIEVFLGDLSNEALLAELCGGASWVFNAAAHVSDWGDEKRFFEVNRDGAERLLAAALTAKVQRFVHLSTVDVFGFERHATVSEASPRVAEPYAYSRSKLAGEERAWHYAELGLSLSVVYPTWIFGPNDRHFIPELLGSLRRGEFVHIDGGRPHLEVVYSENLAEACILIAEQAAARGHGYILGDGYGVNLRQFVTELALAAGLEPPERSLPYWLAYALARAVDWFYGVFRPSTRPPLTAYALRSLANGGRYDLSALQALGYSPRVGLREALLHSVEGLGRNESIPALSDGRAAAP